MMHLRNQQAASYGVSWIASRHLTEAVSPSPIQSSASVMALRGATSKSRDQNRMAGKERIMPENIKGSNEERCVQEHAVTDGDLPRGQTKGTAKSLWPMVIGDPMPQPFHGESATSIENLMGTSVCSLCRLTTTAT